MWAFMLPSALVACLVRHLHALTIPLTLVAQKHSPVNASISGTASVGSPSNCELSYAGITDV